MEKISAFLATESTFGNILECWGKKTEMLMCYLLRYYLLEIKETLSVKW